MIFEDPKLVERWSGEAGAKLRAAVFARLGARRSKSLEGLPLGTHEGRIDLRGIWSDRPEVARRSEIAGMQAEMLRHLLELRKARLEHLDLTGARLESLRMLRCTIRDCRFDGAYCQDWRLWGVEVEDSSFKGADLRSAMLGAPHGSRDTHYHRVDFSHANMREVSSAAEYTDCDFGHAKLANIDFGSSRFTRCRFVGELREVIFWKFGHDLDEPKENPMEHVDFSPAILNYVEFRGLDLDRVILPTSEEHLIVDEYRCVLQRAIAALAGDSSNWALMLRGGLEHDLKWAGSNQQRGVFYKPNLGQNEREIQASVGLLRACEASCRASNR